MISSRNRASDSGLVTCGSHKLISKRVKIGLYDDDAKCKQLRFMDKKNVLYMMWRFTYAYAKHTADRKSECTHTHKYNDKNHSHKFSRSRFTRYDFGPRAFAPKCNAVNSVTFEISEWFMISVYVFSIPNVAHTRLIANVMHRNHLFSRFALTEFRTTDARNWRGAILECGTNNRDNQYWREYGRSRWEFWDDDTAEQRVRAQRWIIRGCTNIIQYSTDRYVYKHAYVMYMRFCERVSARAITHNTQHTHTWWACNMRNAHNKQMRHRKRTRKSWKIVFR